MKKIIRKEVSIEIEEIEGDIEVAEREAKRYERMGYTRYEETDNWIQLDKHLKW